MTCDCDCTGSEDRGGNTSPSSLLGQSDALMPIPHTTPCVRCSSLQSSCLEIFRVHQCCMSHSIEVRHYLLVCDQRHTTIEYQRCNSSLRTALASLTIS